jgi:hypothetical protein
MIEGPKTRVCPILHRCLHNCHQPSCLDWAFAIRDKTRAVGNREIGPALPGTEKRLRYRLQRAADSGSGDLFAKVSNSTQTTTSRECYKPCGKLENEKPVGVAAASREPKMEIPAKGFLSANSTKGAGKAHLDDRLGNTPRHPHAWFWYSRRGAGSANSWRSCAG